jgi:hypothetical protein
MNRQEMMMKNSLIRGTMGMLKDYRMEFTDLAYQYLMDVTNSTTEDDIIPLLRGKSFEELMEINLKVASYLKQEKVYSGKSHLTAEAYKEYGKFKGD